MSDGGGQPVAGSTPDEMLKKLDGVVVSGDAPEAQDAIAEAAPPSQRTLSSEGRNNASAAAVGSVPERTAHVEETGPKVQAKSEVVGMTDDGEALIRTPSYQLDKKTQPAIRKELVEDAVRKAKAVAAAKSVAPTTASHQPSAERRMGMGWVGVAALGAVVAGGIYLVARPGSPAPETNARASARPSAGVAARAQGSAARSVETASAKVSTAPTTAETVVGNEEAPTASDDRAPAAEPTPRAPRPADPSTASKTAHAAPSAKPSAPAATSGRIRFDR